jgi:hypothetical protein
VVVARGGNWITVVAMGSKTVGAMNLTFVDIFAAFGDAMVINNASGSIDADAFVITV